MINHPVHILNEKGHLSPSAFIPFCSFGEDIKVMGNKVDSFDVPVCNSFKAVLHNDQICYQVDIEKFRDEETLEKQLKHGLVIIIDENKDRQFLKNDRKVSGTRNLFSPEEENRIQLHLDTISKFQVSHCSASNVPLKLNLRSSNALRRGGIQPQHFESNRCH